MIPTTIIASPAKHVNRTAAGLQMQAAGVYASTPPPGGPLGPPSAAAITRNVTSRRAAAKAATAAGKRSLLTMRLYGVGACGVLAVSALMINPSGPASAYESSAYTAGQAATGYISSASATDTVSPKLPLVACGV